MLNNDSKENNNVQPIRESPQRVSQKRKIKLVVLISAYIIIVIIGTAIFIELNVEESELGTNLSSPYGSALSTSYSSPEERIEEKSTVTIVAIPDNKNMGLRTFAICEDQTVREWIGADDQWSTQNAALKDSTLWKRVYNWLDWEPIR